ncbi:MAG: hypothetical protein HY558_05065, partial [Euryarchaeota archaeon]|nr:hypothetical protein [Euryarchaeota archaeon]
MKTGVFLFLLAFSTPSLGGSWSGSSSLTSGSHQNLAADGAVDGAGNVWVAWFSNRSQPLLQLYAKSYDGSAWGGDTRLSSSFDDLNPGLALDSSGGLWMVYQSRRAGCLDSGVVQPTYDLCYRNWSGSSWGPPANLSTDGANEFTPQAAPAADGSLRVLRSSDREGNYDILAASLNGSGPGTPVSVTTDSHPDFAPDILRASDGTWWAVWFREMTEGDDTSTELFLRSSSDGLSWSGGETRLTTNSVADKLPGLAQDPRGTYWLAWASTQSGNADIYVANATTPLGLAAAVPQRLTTSAGTDSNPSLVVDNGGTLWLFYESREPPEPQGYVHLRYMTRDDTPPRILSVGPSGAVGSSSATLSATTHENAECRHSASVQNFSQMSAANIMGGSGTKS